MESKINYTLIGFFVIAFSTAIIIGGFWLTSYQNKSYKIYQVYSSEAVSGLTEQAIVQFNGVQVGYVQKIELNYSNLQQAHVLLAIETGVPITTSTVATLNSQGITGITYVALRAETPNAPPLEAKPGQLYPEIKFTPSLLMQVDIIAKKFKEVSESLQKLLDKDNLQAFKQSLQNIQQISDTIAENSEHINHSIKNLDKLLLNTSHASEQLPLTIRKIGQASDQITQTTTQAKSLLQSLSQQALPQTIQILQHINSLTNNLQKISNELAQNPSILVRGKQPATAGPGE